MRYQVLAVMMGHKNNSTWIGVALTTGQCLTNSQDLSKLWTSRTVFIALLCLDKVRSVPSSSFTGKLSHVSWAWWPKTDATLVPLPQNEAMETKRTWDDHLGNG